ncbi:hypothetical protein [Neobacillus niacini]|uniref:hypothetical protein n=1 Tax=Neobacillus niacini TaxID=86668 RepID=UPI0021CAF138|nr:hypothetical protein [Neobacillus niacini]MCM3763480.1 hypothetical protein [Neobacillus niacini]
MKQLYHVYECQDCVLSFAVEQAFEDQSEICCPNCGDEDIRDVGSGEMTIILPAGRVHTWKMTEGQRSEYVKKNPIVPTDKPSGTGLVNVSEMQYSKAKEKSLETRQKQSNRIIDGVDTEYLHKLFMQGIPLSYIADALKITLSTLNNYIKEQRKVEPEKWPRRSDRKN